MRKKVLAVFLSWTLASNFSPAAFAASAAEEMVQKQIQFTKERIAQHKADLKALFTRFAADPSPDVYAKTQVLSANIQKERGILNNLDLAMRDARASASWKAMLDDAAKESSVISAGAIALTSVANAGKWIFGVSQDDLYGEGWKNAEHLNANVMAEAQKIDAESKAILKALTEIQKKIDGGSTDQDILAFQDDLVKRLGKLQARGELVKKNMKFMTQIYKAEKQNLPASQIFWGDTMGRYIDQVIKEVDLGRLIDFAIDLAEGNLVKPLVKLIKPMIKTAIGDYLARARGGAALTPEIIDDLVFSVLFSAGGSGGVPKALQDKLKSKATGKVIEGVVSGVIQTEATVIIGKAEGKAYDVLKDQISKLPVDATFPGNLDVARQTADQLAKQNAKIISDKATKRIGEMKSTGKMIKDLWDLVFKDAIQAYLNSGTFTDSIKAANEACLGWRAQYKKIAKEMIDTEDEYVNAKWFSGGRTSPAATVPTGIEDTVALVQEVYQKQDPDQAVQTIREIREDVQSEPAQKGDMDLSEVQAKEQAMFDMVLAGKMPFSGMVFLDVWTLTNAKVQKPCTDLAMANSKVYVAKSDQCQAIWRKLPINEAAWRGCLDQLTALSADHQKAYQECQKNTVVSAYRGYGEFRAGMMRQVYKKMEEDYLRRLGMIKEDLGDAYLWATQWRSEVENIQKVSEELRALPFIRELTPPPAIPEGIGASPSGADHDAAKVQAEYDTLNKFNTLVSGIKQDRVDQALQNSQFTWEVPSFVWQPVFVQDEVTVSENIHQGWASVCSDQSVVRCSKQRQVQDPSLDERVREISRVNPDVLEGQLAGLNQYPFFANRLYYENFSGFSFAQAMSLYQTALSARAGVGAKSAEVSKLTEELGQSAKVPKAVLDILSFNDVFFQPWQLLRGVNPGLAASRLGKDTEEFKKIVEDLEKHYKDEKQMAVQIDPDSLEKGIAGLKGAYKEYERAFNAYYEYLGKFFTDKEFPEFGVPDLGGFEMQAYGARAEQEMTAVKFKSAATGLQEMKKALEEMERTDQQALSAQSQANAGRQSVLDQLMSFWKAHQKDADLGPALQEIAKAKQKFDEFQTGFGIFDHKLPEKVQKAIQGAGGGDLFAQLRKIEEEVLARQKQDQEENRFRDYALTGTRVNTLDLSKSFGEVVLLPEQLQDGKIVLTGWLSHVDGIQKALFSEDGGRGWREVSVEQAVRVEFSPAAGKSYQPVLRLKTILAKEFDLPFFPNITGLVYRNVPYTDLVRDAVIKLANAYEGQNTSAFAALISRDYIGNRVYLEEGVRFDFDMFTDIRLKIFIDRIEQRGELYVADTHWEKSQNPRKTGQQQMTTGKTVMMFVLEDGALKIKNLRGNLIYATLSPEIAEASGLSQAVVEQIRAAELARDPVQPGAGDTVNDGGLQSAKLTVRSGSVTAIPGFPKDFDFSAAQEVPGSTGDIQFEWNNIVFGQVQTAAQSFEALNEAPEGGYTMSVTPIPGGTVIVFITKEGYYGKMRVTNVDPGPATLTFQYAVQTDGSRNLTTS